MQKIKNLELEINGYLPEINGVNPKFLPRGKHLWRLRLEGNRMEVWKDGKLFSDETIERNEFLNLNFKGLSSGRIRIL